MGLPVHLTMGGLAAGSSAAASSSRQNEIVLEEDDPHQLTPESLERLQRFLAKLRRMPGYKERQQERRKARNRGWRV
jgi:hypothetical protein